MGFSRQEYWSGLPFPSLGNLPNPGNWTQVSCIVDRRFTIWAIREALRDLNQIPYDYAMEVTNRFKGLDLIERVPEELWMEVCDTAGGRDQDHLQEKQMQKGKMVVWGDLRNNQKRREAKDKGENERYTQLNAEFQRKQGEIRKPSSVINAKK